MRSSLLRLRRFLLQTFVPEIVWPKEVTVDGVVVKVRNTPYSFGVKRLLSSAPESYERAERSLLDVINEGDHVLEFGSSIGILTALMCERVTAGRVVSVEVSKPLIDYSRTWLSKYGQLTLIHAAAFPVYQKVDLALSFDNSSGSLGGIVKYSEVPDSSAELSPFFIQDCKRIDGFQPTVMVIDIEGSEKIMLQEELNFPRSIDRVLIELHAFIYGAEIESRIVKRIESEGFTLKQKVESVFLFVKMS